jgi:hypothetical protein
MEKTGETLTVTDVFQSIERSGTQIEHIACTVKYTAACTVNAGSVLRLAKKRHSYASLKFNLSIGYGMLYGTVLYRLNRNRFDLTPAISGIFISISCYHNGSTCLDSGNLSFFTYRVKKAFI